MGCSNYNIPESHRSNIPNININIRTASTRLPLTPLQQFELYLQSTHDQNFNFPEITEDIYVGKGLKRMKGYISPISKED